MMEHFSPSIFFHLIHSSASLKIVQISLIFHLNYLIKIFHMSLCDILYYN